MSYVRLTIKTDYVPYRETPFKKNPNIRQIVIEFVLDLEENGLVMYDRCTNQETVFVCNGLNIPKSNERHRFVCTFTGLNKDLMKDPYGM